jgi:hypothetical protein
MACIDLRVEMHVVGICIKLATPNLARLNYISKQKIYIQIILNTITHNGIIVEILPNSHKSTNKYQII